MGGGLLQLVAYGAQDAYLSGNPQITFWKGLFKRHTNFAMEPFRVNFSGQPNWGTKQSAVIGRHADLLYSTYVEVILPDKGTDGQEFYWNNDQARLGYNLIKYAELEIGGQLIDRLYGEWMFLWSSLTYDIAKASLLYPMMGTQMQYNNSSELIATEVGPGDLRMNNSVSLRPNTQCNTGNGKPSLPNVFYIPLDFFYTRNPGAALPLIALQYHEVKINILWNDTQHIAGNFTKASKTPSAVQAAIYIDYIYLDVEERRRMAQESHEYLIEQTQYNEDKGISSYNNRIDLTFNHPVKELVWVVQPTSYNNCSLAIKYPYGVRNGITYYNSRLRPFEYGHQAVYKQTLQINGQDRLDSRYGSYFSLVQPFQHHTGTSIQPGIYMYSFALRPEEHQPSGTCNFSRIDTATLVMEMSGDINIDESTDNTWDVRVYAVNYNILRIMSGMAGLSYSN